MYVADIGDSETPNPTNRFKIRQGCARTFSPDSGTLIVNRVDHGGFSIWTRDGSAWTKVVDKNAFSFTTTQYKWPNSNGVAMGGEENPEGQCARRNTVRGETRFPLTR